MGGWNLQKGFSAAASGVLGGFVSIPGSVFAQFLAASVVALLCLVALDLLRMSLTTRMERILKRGPPSASPAHRRLLGPAVAWVRTLRNTGFIDIPEADIVSYQRARLHALREFNKREALSMFSVWKRERGKRYLDVIYVGVITLSAAFMSPVRSAAPLIQAVFIMLLLLRIEDPLTDEKKRLGSRSVLALWHAWLAIWFTWIALYCIFFADEIWPDLSVRVGGTRPVPVWPVTIDVLNNISTLLFFVCSVVLREITVPTENPIAALRRLPQKCYRVYAYGAAVIISLTVAEILYHGLWPAGSYESNAFQWLGGYAGGVALALFVGRLESRFIEPPVWLIIVLYVYAVIQGGLGAFHLTPTHKFVLLDCAFVFKCLLFLFVSWLFESGVLEQYFEEVRSSTQQREDNSALEDATET